MFLTRRETQASRNRQARTLGVRVTHSNGIKHFFPGGYIGDDPDPEQALILMRQLLPEEILDHPNTIIEYGECQGPGIWYTKKVIKYPDEESCHKPPTVR